MEPRPVLRAEDLSALAAAGRTRRYPAGQILFNEGDLSDYVVVIRRGTVKLLAVSGDGYEAVLGVRVAGEIVGDFAALQHRPRSATVVAVDEVEAVQVSGARFRAFLAEHPRVALVLLGQAIGRVREADRRRLEYGGSDVAGRVARVLLELAGTFGPPDGTDAVIPLSQRELAGATGASREAVSRALRRLRECEAILTERRRILVLRPDLLRRFAAPDGSVGEQ